ncbi:DUF2790 domain-containing protein [Pseudomonas sp. RIT-To-2]|uniref:DUF2790 domain-containing protein n=1 Tax=Pseudomonas sp. RIT-To-2 TaxID=3462541 RepID=UPI0024134BEB
MKALIVLALSTFSLAAMADEVSSTANTEVPVEHYTYSQHLDIAKVLNTSEIPAVCEVVPARMTYLDSTGQKHILEYRVMGNGCSNG